MKRKISTSKSIIFNINHFFWDPALLILKFIFGGGPVF
jgi:hypothetical protein